MLGKIAPKYFAGGESVLQQACLDMSNWPPLQAGENIQLPMLGTIFQTYIPSLTSANLQQQSYMVPTQTPATPAAQTHGDDLTNVPTSETFTPSLPSNDTKTTTTTTANSNDTRSERSEEYDDACSKNNDNFNGSDDTRPQTIPSNSGGDAIQSREDILDSYKQSKDQLLAQRLKTQSDLPCDKNSSKSLTGANNANEYDTNDNNDGGGGDDALDVDDYSNGSYSDSCTNTQSIECSTNIDRPLRIAHQSPAKTPIVLLSASEIDIFRSLYTVLSYAHLLWELVLTAEPIVVMATSPSDCSHMVQSLMR